MKGFIGVTDNEWFACVTPLKQNKKKQERGHLSV